MARLGRAQSFKPIILHGKIPEVHLRSLPETLTPSETFIKRVNKLFADAVALTETFGKRTNKAVGDAVSFVENLAAVRVAVRSLSDTISFTEAMTKRMNNAIGETVALTESRLLSVAKRTSDNLGFTEGFSRLRVVVRSLGDTLGVTEALRKFLQTRKQETVTLGENLQKTTIPAGGGGPTIMYPPLTQAFRRQHNLVRGPGQPYT